MHILIFFFKFFFFFNDTATTEIYTLSLHDALPISFFVEESKDCVERLLSTIKAAVDRTNTSVVREMLPVPQDNAQSS